MHLNRYSLLAGKEMDWRDAFALLPTGQLIIARGCVSGAVAYGLGRVGSEKAAVLLPLVNLNSRVVPSCQENKRFLSWHCKITEPGSGNGQWLLPMTPQLGWLQGCLLSANASYFASKRLNFPCSTRLHTARWHSKFCSSSTYSTERCSDWNQVESLYCRYSCCLARYMGFQWEGDK